MKRYLSVAAAILVTATIFSGCSSGAQTDKFGLERTLSGHSGQVRSCSLSPDGKTLASASLDGTVRLWNVEDGSTARIINGSGGEAFSVTWAPDGSVLATGWKDGALRIYSAIDGGLLHTVNAHKGWLQAMAYSPDGFRLATGSSESYTNVKIWDTQNWKLLQNITSGSNQITCVTWSPDGTRLVSAGWGGHLKMWNPNTGSSLVIFAGLSGQVNTAAWSPDGSTLISSDGDNLVVFNPGNGGEIRKIPYGNWGGSYSLAFSPNGGTLAAGSQVGYVRLYTTSDWNFQYNLSGLNPRTIYSTRWSADDERIFASGMASDISVFKRGATVIPPPDPDTNGTLTNSTPFKIDPVVGGIVVCAVVAGVSTITVLAYRSSRKKQSEVPFLVPPRYEDTTGADLQDQPVILPAPPVPAPVPEVPTEKALEILRGWEYIGGAVRLKVAVVNRTEKLVTDVRLRPVFDGGSFALDRIEPSTVELKAGEARLGNLNPREKRTCAVYLDPLICTTSNVEGVINFRDSAGRLQTVSMAALKVGVACPLFFTPNAANIAMVRNLLTASLERTDSRVYSIPDGLEPDKAFQLTKEAIGFHSVRHVKDFTTEEPPSAEGWFYGTTKDGDKPFVILVRAFTKERQLAISTYAESVQNICGLLSEIHSQLNEKLKSSRFISGPLKQITNITIRDSIITRSTIMMGMAVPLAQPPNKTGVETE